MLFNVSIQHQVSLVVNQGHFSDNAITINVPASIGVTDEDWLKLLECIRDIRKSSGKVPAIKLARTILNCGLKDAKILVENL